MTFMDKSDHCNTLEGWINYYYEFTGQNQAGILGTKLSCAQNRLVEYLWVRFRGPSCGAFADHSSKERGVAPLARQRNFDCFRKKMSAQIVIKYHGDGELFAASMRGPSPISWESPSTNPSLDHIRATRCIALRASTRCAAPCTARSCAVPAAI